ncbi:hypothetical protein ACO2Q3_22580 [Caulobacter sp. KR2-114]|uniref:hypothetical protein n=1 Tax=Caulobacter sp. KR2-114 TaxID=3400912 RepID=UPI003C074743
MGQRNIDRAPIRMRYHHGRTVADMLGNRWQVISKCRTCGLIMLVNLRLVVVVSGPGVSLWNRRARCRRLGCAGVVDFQAMAPGMDGFQPLEIDERAG